MVRHWPEARIESDASALAQLGLNGFRSKIPEYHCPRDLALETAQRALARGLGAIKEIPRCRY
jgi:hypothetical protein